MECFTFQCHCEENAYFTVYGYTIPGAHAIGNYTHTLGELYSTEGTYELPFDSSYAVYTGALAVGNTVYVSRKNSETNNASWVRSYDAATAATQWTEETPNGLGLPIENSFRVTGAANAISENEIFASYGSGRLLLDSGGQTVYQNPLSTIENEEWRFDLFASHDYPSCGATRVRLVEFEATMVDVTTSPAGSVGFPPVQQWRHSFEFEWTVKVAVDYGQGDYDPSSRRPSATLVETVLYEMPSPKVHVEDVTTSDQEPPAEPPAPTIESLDIRFSNDLWSASRWISFSGYAGDWAGIFQFDREATLPYGSTFPPSSTTVRSPFYPNTYRKLWIGGEVADVGNYTPNSFGNPTGLLTCAVAPRSSAEPGTQTTYVTRGLSSNTARLDVYHGDTIGYSSPSLSGINNAPQIASVSADWALVKYTQDSDDPAPDGQDWTSLPYSSYGTSVDLFYFWFVHRSSGEWQPWRWEDSSSGGTQYVAPLSAGQGEPVQGLFTQQTFLGDMVKTSVTDSEYGPPQDTFGISPP